MEKKSFNNLILVIAVIAIILVVGIGLINAGIITTEKQNLRSNKIQATLIIDYGDETVDGYTLDITNATVYSLLIQASEENNFEVEATYYEQFDSHLIQSINGVEAEGSMYWQYYINGEYAMVSADSQIVENGDIVEWRFEESQY